LKIEEVLKCIPTDIVNFKIFGSDVVWSREKLIEYMFNSEFDVTIDNSFGWTILRKNEGMWHIFAYQHM
jgi:hypothetical protein